MWKNIVAPDKPQMTIWRMRTVFCIHDATDIHSEYVILILFCLIFHCHKGCKNAPPGYVIRTLTVLLNICYMQFVLPGT